MNKIPVVFCFDKRIVFAAAVSIKSLLDCAKDETVYDIRIFHSDLDDKTRREFLKLTEDTCHTMKFHKIDIKRFKNAPKSRHSWREIVYFRLLTPEILTEYDKAIYSDVDVFFLSDLGELYNTDISDYEAGAVASCSSERLRGSKRYFAENKNELTFMSGLILFNCKKMREENTVQKFFKTIDEFRERLVFFDMDVFNLACDKILKLPIEYCVLETMYEAPCASQAAEYKTRLSAYCESELEAGKRNTKIIHYAGKLGKPWHRKNMPIYYRTCAESLPGSLRRLTFRDFRKRLFSKI